MPRQPHTSIWLSATARTRIWTSPGAGAGGTGRSVSSILRSAMRVSARMMKVYSGSMIFSENRYPFFGIMLDLRARRADGLRRLAAHHQRHVLPAEAERVRERMGDLGVARLVRHHVERDRRIGHLIVDGGRNALMREREQGEHRLDRAGGRERVPDHRFVGRDRHVLGALAQYRRDAEIFHLVVLRRAGERQDG